MGVFKLLYLAIIAIHGSVAENLIPAACLIETEETVGVPSGAIFSNKYELISHPDSLRIHSFTNCIDNLGNIIGIQFALKSEDGDEL